MMSDLCYEGHEHARQYDGDVGSGKTTWLRRVMINVTVDDGCFVGIRGFSHRMHGNIPDLISNVMTCKRAPDSQKCSTREQQNPASCPCQTIISTQTPATKQVHDRPGQQSTRGRC